MKERVFKDPDKVCKIVQCADELESVVVWSAKDADVLECDPACFALVG